jgi:hypothetical protein
MVRAALLSLLFVLASGCSAIFARTDVAARSPTTQDPKSGVQDEENRCVPTIGLPVLDTIQAVGSAVLATGALVQAGSGTRAPDTPSPFGLNAINNTLLDLVTWLGVVAACAALVFASSAWYGYQNPCPD